MHHVFILFDSDGKMTDTKLFTPDAQRSPAEYANYIGLDVPLCDSVFRASGKFANTKGLSAVVLGPYADEPQAASLASVIKAAALNVDMALRLVRATGDGA
jgi:hypothetical protein